MTAAATSKSGIQLGLARILSGPEFLLYHGVTEGAAAAAGHSQDEGVTLASRLALFLWNSIPDDAVARRRHRRPARRARGCWKRKCGACSPIHAPQTLVTDFAEQWLQLRLINSKSPDPRRFPSFDDNLRRDMLHETELFLRSVLLEDASVLDLLRADYTFLNERLAEHYGIEGVFGDAFRRVTLRDPNRRGLLGQGSILFQTSVASRTSPVFRGKWIMTNIFNSPPPPPPPNVPALDESAAGGSRIACVSASSSIGRRPFALRVTRSSILRGSRSRISIRSVAGARRIRASR